MEPIGELRVQMSADWASMKRDMDKAVSSMNSSVGKMNRQSRSFAMSMKKSFSMVKTAIAAVGASMAVRQLKTLAEYGRHINDVARSVDISTNALQEFRYAVMQNGGSIQDADNAMQKFSRTIGNAIDGQDTYIEQLRRVGVSLDDIKSKSVEQLLLQVTNNLSKFTNAADRNSAISRIFSEEQVKISKALSMSSEGMEKMRKAAKDSSATISTESIGTLTALADRMDSLWTSFKAYAAEGLAWLARAGGMVSSEAEGEQKYQALLEDRKKIMDELNAAKAKVSEEGSRSLDWLVGKRELENASVEASVLQARLSAQLESINKRISEMDKARSTAKSKLEGERESKALAQMALQMKKGREAMNAEMLTDERAAAEKRMAIIREEFITKAKQMRLITEEGKKQSTAQKAFTDALAQWDQTARKKIIYDSRSQVKILLDDWKNATKQMEEAQAGWLSNLRDSISEAIISGKIDFKSLADAVIADLIRIQVQKIIVGFVGTLGFGGGKAAGGPVAANVPYMVGERGPELFIPRTDGNIMPNEKVSRIGQPGPTVYIDARNADRAGLSRLEAMILKLNGSIEQRAVSAVSDARARGGQFSAAFGT